MGSRATVQPRQSPTEVILATMSVGSPAPDYDRLREKLQPFHQDHVLRWWSELTGEQRQHLADQIDALDLALVDELYREAAKPCPAVDLDGVEPHPAERLDGRSEQTDWRQRGEEAIRSGHVAILLVAGGQGTRLGFDHPKGMFPVGPVTSRTLFQIHAEKVLALGRRYGTRLPFYIMTSPDNDFETRQFFRQQQFFGLDPSTVVFFTQGTMPAVERATGRLLLADRHRIATSPNGHGGVLQALSDGGHLDRMADQGVRHVFLFQVDNPMVRVADAVFLGAHLASAADLSLKVVAKEDAKEKVGVLVRRRGKSCIIEYSDLPDELAEQRTADGQLAYRFGSIAVHFFELAFLRRLAGNRHALPYHRAIKRVPYVDAEGQLVKPERENAYKFEMFIFDTLPLANGVLAVETERREEFEPLKNASGKQSLATVQQALSNLYGGWLERAGCAVPRKADGDVAVPIEISPLYALDAEELQLRLSTPRDITEPTVLQ